MHYGKLTQTRNSIARPCHQRRSDEMIGPETIERTDRRSMSDVGQDAHMDDGT